MKVLVIGSGGREHALIWKLKQSPRVKKIYCAPGNAGIAELAELINIAADDLTGLKKFAKDNFIDLTVVGPENPLVAGIVDEFKKDNLKIFGPVKNAALLEGSKIFSKKIMKKYKVPTAGYEEFTDAQKALEHVYMSKFPLVIKADGLAAGKGVTVARSLVEARKAIKAALQEKVFGSAGTKIIIEEFLAGEEASILAFCDGKNFISMASAQDHKTVFDGDQGPNTGGMGAYSPAPLVTAVLNKEIDEIIFKPMLAGMAAEGSPYVGVLYAGLMITKEGPKIVEFNCRFGDPETQVVLPRLKNDLVEVIGACLDGKLDTLNLEWDERPAVSVVLASEGYPGNYEKGKVISGLQEAAALPDTMVFHAGTARNANNEIVTNGGRVLNVTALGENLKAAIKAVYAAADKIKFEGKHNRTDIGQKALKRLK